MRLASPPAGAQADSRDRGRRPLAVAAVLAFGVAMASVGAADPTQTENVNEAVRAATARPSEPAAPAAAPANGNPAAPAAAAAGSSAGTAATAGTATTAGTAAPGAESTASPAAAGQAAAAAGTAAGSPAPAAASAAPADPLLQAAPEAAAPAPATAPNAASNVPWDPTGVTPPPAAASGDTSATGTASAPAPAAAPAPVAEARPAARPAVAPRASLLPLVQPLWSELTEGQRQILAPLERQWNTMSLTQKRPWLTLADRIPKMGAEKRAKAEERIREWAQLTPEQRRQARNNYRLARSLPKDQRVATWEQYQQMTPEQQAVLRQSGMLSNTAARHAEAFTGLAVRAARPLSPRAPAEPRKVSNQGTAGAGKPVVSNRQ